MNTLRVLPQPALRCAAAHHDDATPCEGGHAVVRVVDRLGTEATGCVHHAAVLYASLLGARVYPSPGHAGAAAEVHWRAQSMHPADFHRAARPSGVGRAA